MPIDAVRRETRITLGDTVLPVGKCETVCSTPVVRKTCIGGEPHTTLLGEIPCTVRLTGTLLRRSLCRIVPALHEALTEHTAFAFTLDGVDYSQMTVTELHVAYQGQAQTADYALTMLGRMHYGDPV